MTTYNTYQEAKIANPECDIYVSFTCEVKEFITKEHRSSLGPLKSDLYRPANPADHCMTVEKFLADGYEFVKGDVALIHNGDVKVVENPNLDWNILDSRDNERYILRAAALEEKETESSNSTSWDEFLVDLNSRLSDEFSDCIKKHPSVSSGSGFEGRCLLVKEDTDFELVEISAREAVYWFDGLPDALYTSADGDEKYESLQHYINNLEDLGKSSLFVKLEKEKSNKQGLEKDCKKQLVDIAASIGAQLISPDKKPRTKVEYVKVTDSIFDLRPDFEAGELFSKVNHARDYSTINNTQTLAQALHQSCCYRRIETTMTERQAFVDEYVAQRNEFAKQNTTADFCEFLADSGKFKLVN